MNKIDFIKWMCERAEGYSWGVNITTVRCPDNRIYRFGLTASIDSMAWERIYYPLLLQRAIEGINRIPSGDIAVIQYPCAIKAGYKNEWKVFFFPKYKSFDQAKEAALKYVYEQEKGK